VIARSSRRDALQGLAAGAFCGLMKVDNAAGEGHPALRLRRGVNTWPWFSLTREFPAPRTDYDWPPFQQQRPTPSVSDLKRLKGLGFDFVRIPVDPGPFLSMNGIRREALMDMLYAAIQTCSDAGLCVVVNVQANEATHYWTSARMYQSLDSAEFPAYLSLVRALAKGLSGFSRVALEPVNEPPQDCSSAAWGEVQVRLLEAIRDAAPRLTLIATGACGSMVEGLIRLDPRPLRKFAPILFTFHFYEPYLFSHQGAPWMQEPVYRFLNSVPWPASAGSLDATLRATRSRMDKDKSASSAFKQDAWDQTQRVLAEYFAAEPDRRFIDGFFGRVRKWAEDHAVMPSELLLGEFGALRTDARYLAAGRADRGRYVRDVREAAEASGFAWAFWNLFDGMGIMDDASHKLDPDMLLSLGLN
jgi:hypothetical protein